jgi:RND family efflux transporter MFP subunit
MSWKKIIAIIAGLTLIAVVVLKLKSNKEIVTERVYQYNEEEPIPVRTTIVKLQDIESELSYTGTFEPNKETKISAETQGKINHISVDVGDYVRKGQALIQLDNSLLDLQVQSVNVQIEGLEADVTRYTILAQSDAIQGVQLEKVALALKSAKIQKSTLLEQINKTTIRAPFSGIVTAKLTEIGAFAAPGMPLLQITDIDQLKFTINISENELNQFQLGEKFNVLADIFPDQPLSGKTILIGSKANMGGSYPVQFALKNLEGLKIKSGMFGTVYFENRANVKGYLIPSSSVLGSSGQPQVYLVKNGKAILQDITILNKIQDKSIVTSGIAEDDVLIVTGLINLFDGANVSFN